MFFAVMFLFPAGHNDQMHELRSMRTRIMSIFSSILFSLLIHNLIRICVSGDALSGCFWGLRFVSGEWCKFVFWGPISGKARMSIILPSFFRPGYCLRLLFTVYLCDHLTANWTQKSSISPRAGFHSLSQPTDMCAPKKHTPHQSSIWLSQSQTCVLPKRSGVNSMIRAGFESPKRSLGDH